MSLMDKGVLSLLPAVRESRAQLYALLCVSQPSDLGANRGESRGASGYLSQHQLAARMATRPQKCSLFPLVCVPPAGL